MTAADPRRNDVSPQEVAYPGGAGVARVRADVRAWIEDQWDPNVTLGEWWRRLAISGWGQPTWPRDWFGRDLEPELAKWVFAELRDAGVVMPPHDISTMMAAPTIIMHGTEAQKRRFLEPMVLGKEVWCQLFSEPGAGSDLANVSTRAERAGDEWVVNGQKVWTSLADESDWGFLLARTDPTVPKHRGITYLLVDMRQPGVEVRPLREMTGEAMFNEVFLSDVRVPDGNVVGAVGDGWRVAMTTLGFERQSMGAGSTDDSGGDETYGRAPIDERVGNLMGTTHDRMGHRMVYGGGAEELLRAILADTGRRDDPMARQEVARVLSLIEVGRFSRLRMQAADELGRDPGPVASGGKLATSRLARAIREAVCGILGPAAVLAGDDAPYDNLVEGVTLFSPSVSIAGGTDEIQHNIVGERVLGLPPEPRLDKAVPFGDLP